ncbi:GlsB/YeaQ/YmgE family stress response membrane protein [Mariniphaga sp.]|uniref:GlsB/YeaQ/YmgE family stress response membrane protein n=1 Tax=Mariniphaga sp. TaxID=1954475 RepID=UPI003565AB6F
MLYVLLIGLVAGAIAGLIIRGKGYGCVLNIIVGIAGAWFGNWLLHELGIFVNSGLFGNLITAVIGAVALLALLGLIRKLAN